MKIKYIINFLFLILFCVFLFGVFQRSIANDILLKGFVQQVPDSFYGTWRVVSNRVETDSPTVFKQKGLDLWNISREFDVIVFSNPISGATARIDVKNSSNNVVEFTKTGRYNNKELTDTINISIEGDTFVGSDTLRLETISDVDKKVMKVETATYSIKGERIAGQNIVN